MLSVNTALERDEFLRAEKFPVRPRVPSVELRCPVCNNNGFSISYASLAQEHKPEACPGCSSFFAQEQGIWNALPPERQKYFSHFIADYEFIRKAEGRGSPEAEFYLALPYRDITERNSWQWSIRSRTYAYLQSRILPNLNSRTNQPMTILDLGAGNGWLSYRLARLGHRPIAVDLLTNDLDGLRAAKHYRKVLTEFFPRFQAELDHLPFVEEQFDYAIFNASFHYSEDYERTLGEAIRCLRPGGTVVIADSPSYRSERSGQQMKEERRESFQRLFGCRSEGLNSIEYLTTERLMVLGVQHDLEWQTHHVWYGFGWACRPLLAKWRHRREPSQFRIYTAKVKES